MVKKANGCWPALVVAGMLALGSAPALAAENTASRTVGAAKSTHHARHSAHRTSASRSEKPAAKTADPKTAAPTKTDAADSADANRQDNAAVPATVANAQAQMTVADTSAPASNTGSGGVQPPPAPAPVTSQAPAAEATPGADVNAPVVAADQLNDVDRAAAPEKPTGKILHPISQTPHLTNASTEDTWGQTSLIGKVFIVLGGCLTLASAARMFIA